MRNPSAGRSTNDGLVCARRRFRPNCRLSGGYFAVNKIALWRFSELAQNPSVIFRARLLLKLGRNQDMSAQLIARRGGRMECDEEQPQIPHCVRDDNSFYALPAIRKLLGLRLLAGWDQDFGRGGIRVLGGRPSR